MARVIRSLYDSLRVGDMATPDAGDAGIKCKGDCFGVTGDDGIVAVVAIGLVSIVSRGA